MNKRELLKRMKAVKSAERFVVPRAEWKSQARETLLLQVKNSLPIQPMPMPIKAKTAFTTIGQQLRQVVRGPALMVASAVAAILSGSLFSVSASERSLPGDLLYPVKIASEQTKLALAKTKTDKVKLKAEYVGRRVDEIKEIASKPERSQKEIKTTAETLKRDLVTVKEQLNDAKDTSTPQELADTAKLIDETTSKVAIDLKELKSTTASDTVQVITEAQVAAVDTSVNALAALVEVQKMPDSPITVEEVNKAISDKVELVKSDLSEATDKLNALPASTTETVIQPDTGATVPTVITASSSAEQITSASSTLSEATKLIEEQKLDEATEKIVEAATALIEANSSLDLVAETAPVQTTTSTESVTSTSSTSVAQ